MYRFLTRGTGVGDAPDRLLDFAAGCLDSYYNGIAWTAAVRADKIVAMNAMAEEFDRLRDKRELWDIVRKLAQRERFNQHLQPVLGKGITTYALAAQIYNEGESAAAAQAAGYFDYHFATIVAVSRNGKDYITMENYARRDPVVGSRHADRDDPLFFFRMNGTDEGETWHEHQIQSNNFPQTLVISLVV